MNKELDNQDWDKIRKQPAVRQTVSSQSFNWFFHLYFGHYVKHATADFLDFIHVVRRPEDADGIPRGAFADPGPDVARR